MSRKPVTKIFKIYIYIAVAVGILRLISNTIYMSQDVIILRLRRKKQIYFLHNINIL